MLAGVARAMRRKKPVQKLRLRPLLTTEEARRRQQERHIEVQATVKRIMPRGLAREWAHIYRAIGEEKTFGTMVNYIQIIALNEGDGSGWDEIYGAAMDDDRLSDGDKDVLVEMVLDLQRRAMFPETVGPPEETDAVIEGLMA